jgi:hypothetical protein
MDSKTIDDFETGGEILRKAIQGLTRDDLLWVPPRNEDVGLWSIQQVVFHLMDDEIIWTARLKSVIAEDNPKIMGFNESKFAAKLFYEAQDPNVAVKILDLNRRQFATVLRNLPESAFSRTGDHSDIGIFSLEQGITWEVEHLHHHVHYIEMKREKLGKPLNA